MKKTYKIEVDCANCANKMEAAVQKTPGVAAATINFMMQKMTLTADDARFDEILKNAEKAIKKVDSACCIVK